MNENFYQYEHDQTGYRHAGGEQDYYNLFNAEFAITNDTETLTTHLIPYLALKCIFGKSVCELNTILALKSQNVYKLKYYTPIC